MIEIVAISSKYRLELLDIFSEIKLSKAAEMFHPHDFTEAEANKIIYSKDLYYLVTDNEKPVGYGMLRGWEEGYKVPSLGIYISQSQRGTGLARLFMQFLHFAAKNNGADKVRLKVYKNNIGAVKLYKSLGYQMTDYNEEEYLGVIDV